MEQRFVVIDEGPEPRIYKLPVNQTARLINEVPGRKVVVFETLNDAMDAALAIVDSAEASANSGIAMFSNPAISPKKELVSGLSKLTEDRVERYYL